MNGGRSLLSSSPPLLSKPSSPSSSYVKNTNSANPTSVPMQRESRCQAVTSVPPSSVMYRFPPFISEEQFADHEDDFSLSGVEVVLATLRQQQLVKKKSVDKQTEKYGFDYYTEDFKRRLLYQPMLWSTTPCPETPTSVVSAKFASYHQVKTTQECEHGKLITSPEFSQTSYPRESFEQTLIKEEKVTRSRRLLERRSKKRKASGHVFREVGYLQNKDRISVVNKEDVIKKIHTGFDSSNLYSLYLRFPEKKQLLTADEEKDLFIQIQDLLRLEGVKERLQTELGREPTLGEWSRSVDMSCYALQSCISCGQRSREKVMHSHIRLVAHIAKRYRGHGLDIHDLMQEGSLGLLVSLDRFKPKIGSRFASYAFWWIRQSIRKAIFSNSRLIRLPEHVHAMMKKIKDIRTQYIFEEGRKPSNEEIARRLGICTERLAKVLFVSRQPKSIQEKVWLEDATTFQEVTTDPAVEEPELSVSKAIMRHRVHEFLGTLPPRDRVIVEGRFGFRDGQRRSLEEIGNRFGITKERVRQLEARAVNKLKECLHFHEVQLYKELLL